MLRLFRPFRCLRPLRHPAPGNSVPPTGPRLLMDDAGNFLTDENGDQLVY